MTFPENLFAFAGLKVLKPSGTLKISSKHFSALKKGYDPEMIYVECQKCGRPVVWAEGKTTAIITEAGIDIRQLDERCMIISDGCPTCASKTTGGFGLSIVRLAGLTPEEALLMEQNSGNA